MSRAALLSREINRQPPDGGARSISRWSEVAARSVALQPARFFQELDKSEHRCRELAPAQVDDVPVAPDRETPYVQLDETLAGKLERAGVARDHGQAKSRFDRVLDSPVRADLHRDVQLPAPPPPALLPLRPPPPARPPPPNPPCPP